MLLRRRAIPQTDNSGNTYVWGSSQDVAGDLGPEFAQLGVPAKVRERFQKPPLPESVQVMRVWATNVAAWKDPIGNDKAIEE